MVDKIKEVLIDWAINFTNHKAMIKNDLEKIERKKDSLKAIYEDKEVNIIVEPFISDAGKSKISGTAEGGFDLLFDKISKEEYVSVVLFNSKENFEIILENWKRLIDFDKLTIYFVNMFSSTETKWVVKPYLHNMITDEKSLKPGLKSMFSMVEPITKELVERKTMKNV